MIGSLILLELVLQVGHLVVSSSHAPPSEPELGVGERVVMCVGDSFTWGLGAASRQGSYPAQMEPMLQSGLGPEWRVVNRGWPGQNSREALLRLGEQLGALRPEVVCLVIGTNDRWTRPDELDLSIAGADEIETVGEFRLEWRSARLFLWIKNELLGIGRSEASVEEDPRDSSSGPAALIGRWHMPGLRVRFAEDGSAGFGGIKMRWSVEGDRLRLSRDGMPDELASWRRVGERLILRRQAGGDELVLLPLDEFIERKLAIARAAVEQGDLDHAAGSAAEALRATLPGDRWAPRVHLAVYRVMRARGQAEEVARELVWLRERAAARPDAVAVASLLEALVLEGRLEEAAALADRARRDFAASDRVWHAIALLAEAQGRSGEACMAIDRAVERIDGHWRWRAVLHRSRADLYAGLDERQSLASLLRAYRLDRDYVLTDIRLRQARTRIGEAELPAFLDDPALDGQAREDLRALLIDRGVARTHGVMRRHLEQMIERARAAGAAVFVGSYPDHRWNFYKPLREAAEAAGAVWVPIHQGFAQLLAADPGLDLFVAGDCHCNDAGYRVMAELMAAAIVDRLGGK